MAETPQGGQATGPSMTVLCAAKPRQRDYLYAQVLGPGYRERCVGRVWLWDIEKVARRQGCCAVLLQVRASLHRLLGRGRWLCVPKWVVGAVDIPLPQRVLKGKSLRDDSRKIRKHAFRFEISQNARDLEDYYHNMYVPYISQRHGGHAFLVSFDRMRKVFKNGELLRVLKDGMPVAGVLIHYGHDGAMLWVLGIRDGNGEWVRQGAIGALYHLSFQYLRDRGFSEVGMGTSSSFLSDGVLQYKKKFGMRLQGARDARFLLRVPDNSEAAEAFLRANPFVFERDGGLFGVCFVDARDSTLDEAQWQRIYQDFHFDGMSRLLVVPLPGSPVRSVTIPPGLADRVSLCSCAEVIGWGPRAQSPGDRPVESGAKRSALLETARLA